MKRTRDDSDDEETPPVWLTIGGRAFISDTVQTYYNQQLMYAVEHYFDDLRDEAQRSNLYHAPVHSLYFIVTFVTDPFISELVNHVNQLTSLKGKVPLPSLVVFLISWDHDKMNAESQAMMNSLASDISHEHAFIFNQVVIQMDDSPEFVERLVYRTFDQIRKKMYLLCYGG